MNWREVDERLIRRGEVSKMLGDGAYDHAEVYEDLEARGIEATIKPRKKSCTDTPSPARRMEVNLYKHLGHIGWTRLKNYGKRWSIETAYSTFKRAFGTSSMAKTMENITNELMAKATIYNMLINLQDRKNGKSGGEEDKDQETHK